MNPNTPKISFIPKSPLAGQESFLNRRRPRSALNILAGILFFVSLGTYAGIYVYGITLTNTIKLKTEEINTAYESFKSSSVIAQAKIFQARTEIGKELLDSHNILSPLFKFLEENTLETIYFESLEFVYKDSQPILVLKGEAPGYASLAYQADVLRRQNDALKAFVVSDVELTPTGSVVFSLEESLLPSFISYVESFNKSGEVMTLGTDSTSLPTPGGDEAVIN